jgi:hypothetical protein
MDIYERHITIHAMISVSAYKKSNHQPVENRLVNMLIITNFTDNGDLELKTVEKWFHDNDQAIQKLVEKSDEYAEID